MLIIFFAYFSSVPPAIVVRQETVYASFGQKIVLECISESHPNSFNYWLDPSGKKIIQGTFSPFKRIDLKFTLVRMPVFYLK